MNRFIKTGFLGFLVALLVGCGVNTEDYNKVVVERDGLRSQLTEKNATLTKVTRDLEVKKQEFESEKRAKLASNVREEQAKQRLKQAERDLAAALRELTVYKGKKK